MRVLRAVWTEVAHAGTPQGSEMGDPAEPKMKKRLRRKVPTALKVVQPPQFAGMTETLVSPITIGRGTASTITLEDSFLSSVHARVTLQDGQWKLEDLGSTNGTYHDGERVTSAVVIQKGDRIQMGNIIIEAI